LEVIGAIAKPPVWETTLSVQVMDACVMKGTVNYRGNVSRVRNCVLNFI